MTDYNIPKCPYCLKIYEVIIPKQQQNICQENSHRFILFLTGYSLHIESSRSFITTFNTSYNNKTKFYHNEKLIHTIFNFMEPEQAFHYLNRLLAIEAFL